MTRVFMLGFILSRMLQPISFIVFLVFITMVFLCSQDGPVTALQSILMDVISPLHATLILMTIVIVLTVFSLVIHFLLKVLLFGKYVVTLSMLGFLIALGAVQLFVYFSLNLLPNWNGETILYDALNSGALELIALLMTGNLLALYVGVLSREKFKKNVGFIDDSI